MKKVIAALKGAGVLAKDLQPSRSRCRRHCFAGNSEDRVGYTASNTVNAEIKGIGPVGSVMPTSPSKPDATECFAPVASPGVPSRHLSTGGRSRTAVAAAQG